MMKFKIMSGQISIEATDLSNTESVRKFIASGGVLKYTVQPGDTLSEIAFYCGLDYQHLAAINNIDNPNHIFSGMDLRISKQKGDGVVVSLAKAEDFKPTEEFKLAQANLSDEMMSTPTHPFGSLEFRLKWHKLLENVDTATINAPIQIVRAPESKFKIVYSITQDDTVYDSYDRASMEVEKWLYKNINIPGYTYFETDPKDDPDGLTYGMLIKNREDDSPEDSEEIQTPTMSLSSATQLWANSISPAKPTTVKESDTFKNGFIDFTVPETEALVAPEANDTPSKLLSTPDRKAHSELMQFRQKIIELKKAVDKGTCAPRIVGDIQNIFDQTFNPAKQFIVGTKVEDGTFQFGYRPKIHVNAKLAVKEAERLSERYKKTYTIFRATNEVAASEEVSAVTPIKDTKQGLRGKKIESPYRVMTNWQERMKTIDLDNVSAPFSITLTFEKKWLIAYSSHEDSVVVDTYDDVLINISNWLIANKTQSLSQQ